MAIDEAIMEALRREKNQTTTLRFYSWDPPAVSIGSLQKLSRDLTKAKFREFGLDAVRRPTGGRIVLHKKDFTFSLIFSENDQVIPKGILPSYHSISQAVKLGFETLGVPTQMSPERKISASSFCFSLLSKYEIIVQGKKIMGNAQKRKKGVVLHQGSIMLEDHRELIHELFGPGKEEYISLSEVLDTPLSVKDINKAILRGFKDTFHISFIPGFLTACEQQEAERLCKDKYSQDRWNIRGEE